MGDIYLIIILVAVFILCLAGILVLKYAKKKYPDDIDLMEGHDFEYFVRICCVRRAFRR